MNNLVIVINGSGGSGKDTLVNIIAEHASFAVNNIDSVAKVKECALALGWNGVKDERGRRLLSDIKQVAIDNGDIPLKYCVSEIETMRFHPLQVISFVHIREPEEIFKLRTALGNKYTIKTLLVTNPNVDAIKSNESDAYVTHFKYDWHLVNDKTLEHLEHLGKLLIEDIKGLL